MLVCVTLRLAPRRRGQRLSGTQLQQEAERIMDRLLGCRPEIDTLGDVLVAGDAGSGQIAVTGILASDDEPDALERFTAFFQKVSSAEAASDPDLITYLLVERSTELRDTLSGEVVESRKPQEGSTASPPRT
nr:hypothetical protein [Micromonospora sp. DSM 115978]